MEERQTLRTSAEDELLYRLESDFVRLLKTARHPDRLLEAESLLAETNDNTHWTNYSKATSIIRLAPDKAAIPLLLRYMVLHTKRSSRHIMVPEYEKTLMLISGKVFNPKPDSRDYSEAAVRLRVQAFVDRYWADEAWKETKETTEDDLRVIAKTLLEESRRNGDFSGSGGGRDTAYRAYHNVYYRIRSSSSSEHRLPINELHQGIVPYLLEPFGYQSDINAKQVTPSTDNTLVVDMFPYEAIPILADLANNGQRDEIAKIAEDKRQNATVRMVCIYSLFRAGGELRAESLIEILKSETRLQRRLILLLSLRWAGGQGAGGQGAGNKGAGNKGASDQATDLLLDHIDDPNVEVAIAAACALRESQPDAALPKIKRLFERDRTSNSSLVFSTLGDWKSCAAKQFLAEMVAEALEEKHDDKRLDNALSAFVDAADLPRANWRSPDYHLRTAARVALAQYHDLLAKAKADRDRLRLQTESVRTQWMTATQIESLRKGEYRRLLGLQADGIVTAEESKAVHERLVQVQTEVESLRKKLVVLEAKLATIQVCDEDDHR
ncbi:hypothetical protein RMSM_07460 [Rhodopirellula maiorica SM1]|uniref:HEAT repeat domain-containing protein n=1 Tax=Rhodopirellula maiorica SM1 TaxID=1265738 RepID=M5RNS9_9BACT|nr:hypothetical protein RMSM_07460 [Rhodopirellula maiorica SM1]